MQEIKLLGCNLKEQDIDNTFNNIITKIKA